MMGASVELYDVAFKTVFFANPRFIVYQHKELLINLFEHSQGSFFISHLEEDGWRYIVLNAREVILLPMVKLL
jgi:hypothetical protein